MPCAGPGRLHGVRLPQVRNLLRQFDLEGGGPHTATRLESVEGVVVVDGGGESAIENHHHCLPDHLHEAYAVVVLYPFWDQYHRLTGSLLLKDSVSES